MKINYFNADHTHALIDLPTNICIEEIVKLFKGSSSHWINQQKMIKGHFSWGRGYGAFSVSHSDVDRVARYIASQDEHHRKKTFAEEYELFVKRYGLEWRDEKNRWNGFRFFSGLFTGLKPGENERAALQGRTRKTVKTVPSSCRIVHRAEAR